MPTETQLPPSTTATAPVPAATPAPSPSPTPAPLSAPAPSPEPARVPTWEEDLEKIGMPKEPVPPDEPEETPPEKPVKQPAPVKKETAPPAPPAKPDQDGVPIFQTNKDLRKWAAERHKTNVALENEKQQLQSKLQQLESIVPKTQQEGVVMTEAMASMQKQIAEYEKALATHVFEQSPKYINDYQKPFMTARDKAYKAMGELTVTEATGEMDENGEPKMRQRPATTRDFDYIYSLPRAQARQAARKMFGDDADEVIEHRRTLSDLAEKAIEAVESHKKNYAEETKAAMARQTQERNATAQLWRTANEKISADTRFAHLWGEDKEDAEANEALTKGFQMADMFFSEERDKLSSQDRVVFDANIRHRIAGFSRLAHKLSKVQAALDAANATIAEMKGSAPGKPVPDGGKTPEEPKGWEDALNKLPE